MVGVSSVKLQKCFINAYNMLYVCRVGSIKLFFRYPIFLCLSYITINNVFDKLYFVVSMNVSIGSKPMLL